MLKNLFDDLPDVRVTTRKLFDTKVRVDFPTYEAAKLFKNKYVPPRPKYKDSTGSLQRRSPQTLPGYELLSDSWPRSLETRRLSKLVFSPTRPLSTRRTPASHKKVLFENARLGPTI